MDPRIWGLIEKEKARQKDGLELIPSENFASKAVLEALGSVLNNKYSEGYPGKRYYAGNFYIDQIENLAIKRAQKLFKTDYFVNVQPYSGSPANMAVYFALLSPADKLMGMRLDQGGHLTHGHKVSFSGIMYQVASYGVDEKSERLDYKVIEKLALKEKPKLIVCGATAYPRKIDFKKFAQIARKVGAYLMADVAHIAGLIATGYHPSPFGLADIVTTTTHKTLRGPRGAMIFSKDEEIAKKINKAVFPGLQGGPHNHATAAIAVALYEASKASFKKYARQIIKNAQVIAKELVKRKAKVISGGTDNHLLLVDVRPYGLAGAEAESLLEEVDITVNKNTIPYDPAPPFKPSGIRLGTPAITSRGMKEKESKLIAQLIDQTLKNPADKKIQKEIAKQVKQLTRKFPLPGTK